MITVILFVLSCSSTRELTIEKGQFGDVKENVLKGSHIVKVDTLPAGMLKIKYKE